MTSTFPIPIRSSPIAFYKILPKSTGIRLDDLFEKEGKGEMKLSQAWFLPSLGSERTEHSWHSLGLLGPRRDSRVRKQNQRVSSGQMIVHERQHGKDTRRVYRREWMDTRDEAQTPHTRPKGHGLQGAGRNASPNT